jgi:hypothetical protein
MNHHETEEIQIGPWFFSFEWHKTTPEWGELHVMGFEQTIAYGELVDRSDWDRFKEAAS